MTIDKNDPRLTAFVLGELSEDETKEVQAALDADAELCEEVEAIRKTVAEIEDFMKTEPIPGETKVSTPDVIDKPKAKKSRYLNLSIIACTVFIAAVGLYYFNSRTVYWSNDEISRVIDSPSEYEAKVVRWETRQSWKTLEKSERERNVWPEAADESFSADLSIPAETTMGKDVVRGLRSAPSPALGEVTMMVTPRIIVQEEEEEYLAGTPADPYNSANDEAYKNFVENDFLRPQKAPFSTFSIDVDTAAYTTMRRYINQGQRPPAASVRLEEYVNYFKYDYAPPTDGRPFATHVDVAPCPWEPKHLLARIGIKGREYPPDLRPGLNLVFLIDTSGSMSSSNRLPLVQRGLTELVEMLQPKDRVAIVTYAGSSKLALPSVSGQEKRAILDSINSLRAGGSTAGASGIKTAYETARKYYNENAQNRVILCTDGDFNVGTTDNSQLERMIGEEAKSGVFLTILGFGMGNYKDERLKTLSMRGNGNYGYIDTIEEARRLLVEGLTGTLFAIAKDVKIQVDFNPARVAGYRLLGYENRKLRDEDFHNDKIDAGEIGAGHTVTALYEIVPVGGTVPSKVDESRYAEKPGSSADAAHPAHEKAALEGELMFVKLRYKQPDGDKSSLLEYPVVYNADAKLSGDAEFAAGVALYGMLLCQSRYSGAGTFDTVLELAEPNVKGNTYRKEFVELVRKVKELR